MVVTQKLMIEHMKNVHNIIWKSKETMENPQEINLTQDIKKYLHVKIYSL